MPNPIHNLYKHTMHDILQAYYIRYTLRSCCYYYVLCDRTFKSLNSVNLRYMYNLYRNRNT